MINTHELKTWPTFFEHVLAGRKLFEIRKDDRNYRSGDLLHLREFDNTTQAYTGREMEVEVTYIMRGALNNPIQKGYCVMAIKIPKV
jgi:hypothetical protein